MGCVTAATQNGFTRAGLTLLLPRIGTFASLHDSTMPRVSDNCPRTADTHFGFRPTLGPPMVPQSRAAARCIKNRPQKCATHDSHPMLLARQSRITRLGAYAGSGSRASRPLGDCS
jgi:hypothetical protein